MCFQKRGVGAPPPAAPAPCPRTTIIRRMSAPAPELPTPAAAAAKKKKKQRRRKKAGKVYALAELATFIQHENVLPEACGGVYFALPRCGASAAVDYPDWCLGSQTLSADECADAESTPDLAIDPDDGVLSLINASADTTRTYFVTIEKCASVLTRTGVDLMLRPPVDAAATVATSSSASSSASSLAAAQHFPLITFNAILRPRTSLHLCVLAPDANSSSASAAARRRARRVALESVSISSDIQDYVAPSPPAPDAAFELDVFPLGAAAGPFLCTQGAGGALTHFCHPSTYHAVDLRCAVGTPVLAVFDGEITEVRIADAQVTGVHCDNLFAWNGIVLRARDERSGAVLVCEYVHVSSAGVCVAVGDRVVKGQQLCASGEAGFCPEPHLHIEVKRSTDVDAPSVPLMRHGKPIVAGQWYV